MTGHHSSSSSTTTTAMHPTQQHTIQLHQDDSSSSSLHELPPPPVPSSDPHLQVGRSTATADDTQHGDSKNDQSAPDDEHDLFKLPALEAVKLLSASIEVLARMTGDVPPTPPLKTATDPQMSGMQAEKEDIARTHSEKNLFRMRQLAEDEKRKVDARNRSAAAAAATSAAVTSDVNSSKGLTKLQAYNNAMQAQLTARQPASGDDSSTAPSRTITTTVTTAQDVDGVQLKKALTSPLSPPPPHTADPEPYVVIGADSQPLNLQHGAITRKFYSKNEPPITITAYLLRLHQFCPMSTAVYLATSLYIHRLAIHERAIPVTRRNAHRLVLAGLRVAMKALEDLSYSHSKIAKVGGVSELELARLEVSFCFLTGFELVVGEEKLRRHWETLRNGKAQQILNGMEVPTLRLTRKPRKVNPPPDG